MAFQDKDLRNAVLNYEADANMKNVHFENVMAVDSIITIENLNVVIETCRFKNSSVQIVGNPTSSEVHVKDTVFTTGSTMSIQGAHNMSIKSSQFETALDFPSSPTPQVYMLEVRNVTSASVSSVTFSPSFENPDLENTESMAGVWIEGKQFHYFTCHFCPICITQLCPRVFHKYGMTDYSISSASQNIFQYKTFILPEACQCYRMLPT